MQIKSLIQDIYKTVESKNGDWTYIQDTEKFGQTLAGVLKSHFSDERPAPRLRLSQMGPRCPRALWYSIHHPELAEKLPAWAQIKYSYGHIIEAVAIALAKASGHEVTGEQDVVSVDGVEGHRDCVIDGCIVDVKSASSYSFQKFKTGSIRMEDSFGYLDQLDGYLVGSLDDDLVRVKDKAYLLAVDKTLGHMALYEHSIREEHIRRRISDYRRIVSLEQAPSCTCGTVPDGKSGNIRLDTKASYNLYKYSCFPKLRTFVYADGPKYLTTVVRKPDVIEIDKHGKVVYN